VYILDEPTTGLHFDDVRKLLDVINGLVDKGNTVIVIEHNLDVIKSSDWIVDMGPEGGAGGGTVITTGTPEQVAADPVSYTGQFLAPILAGRGHVPGKEQPTASSTAADRKTVARKAARQTKAAARPTPSARRANPESAASDERAADVTSVGRAASATKPAGPRRTAKASGAAGPTESPAGPESGKARVGAVNGAGGTRGRAEANGSPRTKQSAGADGSAEGAGQAAARKAMTAARRRSAALR
jgi:excinuclease ABC subunit A